MDSFGAILRTFALLAVALPITLGLCWVGYSVTMWQYHNAPYLLIGAGVMLAWGIVAALLDIYP